MSDAEDSEDSRSTSGLRRRDVLRGSVAVSSVLGIAGCVTTTDDGFTINFGETDEPTPTKVPTNAPADTPADTPTETPTKTEYPTPTGSRDCIPVDPGAVEIEENSGQFQIVDGENILALFDEFENAKAARDIIAGYGLTQQCFVGRPNPPFEYWLVDGFPPTKAAATPVETEDCISLDPDAIEVEEDGNGGYLIVDGEQNLLVFDELAHANRTRDLIKHYGFTRQCFVGRPDPPFTYWLAEG